jgi:hypothetical protein
MQEFLLRNVVRVVMREVGYHPPRTKEEADEED